MEGRKKEEERKEKGKGRDLHQRGRDSAREQARSKEPRVQCGEIQLKKGGAGVKGWKKAQKMDQGPLSRDEIEAVIRDRVKEVSSLDYSNKDNIE